MMRVTVSGRRKDISDKLKEYSEEKAGKLERYYDRVHSVEVVFDVDGSHHRCEVIAKADHHSVFVAKEERDEPYGALDAVMKDLERQLVKHKEKFRNRKHITGATDREPMGGADVTETPDNLQTEGDAS